MLKAEQQLLDAAKDLMRDTTTPYALQLVLSNGRHVVLVVDDPKEPNMLGLFDVTNSPDIVGGVTSDKEKIDQILNIAIQWRNEPVTATLGTENEAK